MTLSSNYSTEKNVEIAGSSSSLFVDELIWGHRFYDEQTAEMTLLEFLNVAADAYNNHQLLAPLVEGRTTCVAAGAVGTSVYGNFRYRAKLRLRVRELVFNNPYIDFYANQPVNNDELWKKWEKNFKENSICCKHDDLGYLKRLFNSFNNFHEVITLLRANAFETLSNKRWTSKYLFPYGINSLYEDINIKKISPKNSDEEVRVEKSADRRFFARTGEMLYLMLSLSKDSDEIATLLEDRFFKETNTLDNLVNLLQHDEQHVDYLEGDLQAGFLPLTNHPIFDKLGEDWLHILKNNIPINDALYYLSQISYLHIIRYLLGRSKEIIGDNVNTEIVCEILSHKRSKIRTLSADRFIQNASLSIQAVTNYIDNVTKTEEWKNFSESRDISSIYNYLVKYFKINSKLSEELKSKKDSEGMLQFIKDEAVERHKTHVYLIHREFGKQIGLVSRVATNRFRYILSDQLLKTLIVANVNERMTTKEFYSLIYHRYEIVVSQVEGSGYVDSNRCDNKDFEQNIKALENRLNSLGLLIRLSDSFSYILNPFNKHN